MATSSARAEFDADKYLVYNWGHVSLRPRLEIGETYDSNLFYAETNRVDDFVSTIRPGMSLLIGDRENNFISLTYALGATFYADRSDLDYIGHGLFNEARFRLKRVQIKGQDSLSITRTTLGGSFSYVQRPVGMTSLSDAWQADYDISPKSLVGCGLQFDYIDYDAADLGTYNLFDYSSLQGNVRVGYLPSEKLILFPQVTFGESWLSPNNVKANAPELTTYGFNLGAEGEFTPKLSGRVTGGYEFRQYSDSSEVPDGWVASLEVKWQPRPKTSVSVGYRHWIQATRDSSGVAYTADRPFVSVVQELGTQGRWTVGLDGYYQFDDYSRAYAVGGSGGSVRREDDMAGVGCRASFRWTPWLTAVASYDFSTYSDNIQSSPNYDVHRISLRLAAGY